VELRVSRILRESFELERSQCTTTPPMSKSGVGEKESA
jgi:hypothetical protein